MPVVGVWTQLWRVVIGFRLVTLGYAGVLILQTHDEYAEPTAGLVVLGVMVLWTVLMTVANSTDLGRSGWVIAIDTLVCAALVLSTLWIETDAQRLGSAVTLPTVWSTSPVLAAAVRGGRWGGMAAALTVAAALVVVRGEFAPLTVGDIAILLLTGIFGGWVVSLAVRTERALAAATRREVATQERERLARDIHDGVLQVLALVQRRGREIGGDAAELGRLAGEQEVALRTLVSAPAPSADAKSGDVDLAASLGRLRRSGVEVSTPATPVPLPAGAVDSVVAAVRSALQNVELHAGGDARVWVLVEDLGDEVVVSVRDDGCGMPPDRPSLAEAEGRMGIARSMRGRIEEIGGRMSLVSAPGEGTEVEFVVPRRTPVVGLDP